MDKARRNSLMWRWSLLTAGLITLFWAIWYLINGNVPTTTQIIWDKQNEIIWTLPFGISRWWDILFGVVWMNIWIILVVHPLYKRFQDGSSQEDLFICLVTGLILLTAVLSFGLVLDLVILVFGLIACLIFGLILGLIFIIKLSEPTLIRIGNWLTAKECHCNR